MYRLFQMQDSGNCYKIRLLMSHLRIPCEIVETDILKGESRTPAFLAMNPNGKTPTLQLDDATFLPESNAALFYLARDTTYLPAQRLDEARVLQWMFFEQYSHEPYIATSRFWISILKQPQEYARQIEEKRAGGLSALSVMEHHLRDHEYFVADQYSIADIALYAYTHVAGEGGFELSAFPAICAWLERIRGQPGHISIDTPYPDFA